jgi:hypothetical protein
VDLFVIEYPSLGRGTVLIDRTSVVGTRYCSKMNESLSNTINNNNNNFSKKKNNINNNNFNKINNNNNSKEYNNNISNNRMEKENADSLMNNKHDKKKGQYTYFICITSASYLTALSVLFCLRLSLRGPHFPILAF